MIFFNSKSFRTIVFVFVFFHNLGNHFSQVESFLCPDKQGTPAAETLGKKKNNKYEDNSPKTLTDIIHSFYTYQLKYWYV